MSDDLISDLRLAALIAGPNARDLYLAAADEIERCHARLEIDQCSVMRGDQLVRRSIPYSERRDFPDGITCRDATISEFKSDR